MRQTVIAVTLLVLAAAPTYGQPLSMVERQAMNDTLQYALENNPSNQPSDWVNPDTGRAGVVAPLRTFSNEVGQPCREFVKTIIIGGKEEQGYGTACRQPDGSWQIVSDVPPPAPPRQTTVYVYDPPERYYYYPSTFYPGSRIYLSFGFVFRDGHWHRGHYHMGGRQFRNRYPVYFKYRFYDMPRRYEPYRRHRDDSRFRYERHERYEDHDRYRSRDREGDRDRYRSRERSDDRDRYRSGERLWWRDRR